MDAMQIKLKLAMDVLSIPLNVANYQRICNAAYLCEHNGVYISPAPVLFDSTANRAYSLRSHEFSGCPSRSLYDDVRDIEYELSSKGLDDSENWKLDEESLRRLNNLKAQIENF